jgi:phospholipid/cholesterol/gamma-HCH transport system ATP-binding protein
MMIELKNVTFAIENKLILDDVSLKVPRGTICVILGPSGAGKSSILKLILGLWKPQRGNVFIDGTDISKLSEKEMLPIRRRMGLVFQQNALFDSLSVEDNVGYFLKEKGELSSAKIRERVREALSFVNLKGNEKLCPDQLSGGMKKRVAIARAIATKPDIILYDEPTTGLDPINSKAILNLITRGKHKGATSIAVTHILNDAIYIGDLLVVINEGKIVDTGTVEEMLNSQNKFIQDFFYEVYLDANLFRQKAMEN